MNIKELKSLIADLPDDTTVVRGDNSGGYEKIYEPHHQLTRDNFSKVSDLIPVFVLE